MNYYPIYSSNQFYLNDLQAMRDKIDKQMQQIQMQQQQQQPMPVAQQPITQNFQISPQPNNNELESKFVDNIEDVKKIFVIKTGIFTNKDFSNLWVKDISGNIRTFKTEEVIEMDEKDKEIFMLKKQIEEMKQLQANQPIMEGDVLNGNERNNKNINESVTNQKSSRVSNNKYSNAKQ